MTLGEVTVGHCLLEKVELLQKYMYGSTAEREANTPD